MMALTHATFGLQMLGGGFTLVDWIVVVGILIVITVLGERLTGRQESVRDFYLGGRNLPWYAVAASIVATEISAVTFFAVPSLIWREGGSLLYLQIGLFSALVARCVVAWVLVPAYYEREIYSPYEFMGNRLGPAVRRVTTGLFMVGGVLAQASRVYITAVVIEVLAKEQLDVAAGVTGLSPIAVAVLAITVVAVLWTWIGGVATVVWTDAFLFLLFLAGMGTMLAVLHGAIDGGLAAAWELAEASGRTALIDTDFAFSKPYTLVAVLFAASWGLIGPYGTDQLIVQRLLCCRSRRDASRAMLASYAAVVVIGMAFLVGVGLLGYYASHAMSPGAAELVAQKPERILPVFVREALPPGVRGLVLAAAFAAAISSLDSILAALGQSSLASFWTPWRRFRGSEELDPEAEGRASLRASRGFVLAWAVILGVGAVGMGAIESRYDNLLDLALGMSGFAGGPLLAGFALSLVAGGRGASGFVWAAPLGLLTVVFAVFNGPGPHIASWYVTGPLLAAWLLFGLPRRSAPYGVIQTLIYAFALFLLTRLAEVGDLPDGRTIAWPWYVPVGSTVTFAFSLVLDKHARRG